MQRSHRVACWPGRDVKATAPAAALLPKLLQLHPIMISSNHACAGGQRDPAGPAHAALPTVCWSGPDTPPAAPAAESNTAAASTVSGSEAEAKEWIAQKESGGSYTATNGRYIGRYQLTDSYLNGDYSAENQERVADAYVAGRYGSWTAAKNFWLNNGWY